MGSRMSYREENNQVVLTMSRDDYETLLMALGAFTVYAYNPARILEVCNRLNEGNPNYTPYEVEKSK
ncbi:MAG: hypothetical protein JWO19_4394 [Bryobacterales bacterium]|nr:hypothetical protein [Bryobacterales bacterium]